MPEPVVKAADEPVEEEPVVVVTDLNPERFYGPLFRSARKFHNDKNPKASAKHAEDVMIDVDVVKAAQVVGLRSEAPVQAVVLPAAVAVTPAPTTTAAPTTTTAAPTTTTTAAPTTTTPAPTTTTTAAPTTTTTAAPTTTTAAPTTTTTAAPTTTTAAPKTTTAAAVTPLRIKSFVVGANGRPVFRPTSAPVVNTVNTAQVPDSRQPKALESSPRPKGNYQFNGKSYLLTWRNHRNNFDWNGGVQYCRSKGMKLISLDTKEKSEHFLRLVATDRAPYFWAGGRLSRDGRSLSWQNGKTESVSRGQHPWSFTGRTGPQPDGGEVCLAVLNNVYR